MLYTLEHRGPPEHLEDLTGPESAIGGDPLVTPAMLIDPWGVPYVYVRHDDGTWMACTLGADSKVDGEGANADIEVRG